MSRSPYDKIYGIMVFVDLYYGGNFPCYPTIVSNSSQSNSSHAQVSRLRNLISYFRCSRRLGKATARESTSIPVVVNQNYHILSISCFSSSSIIRSTLFKRLWVLFSA